MRAQWAGLLALFLVLAGGTAWAVNEWTGANIVNESLTGADVKGSASVNGTLTGLDVRADSLEGADVLETSLGKVADADRLDNLSSGRFVQGASAVPGVFDIPTAKSYFNRITNPADTRTSTMLVVPGILHVDATCSAGAANFTIQTDVAGLDTFRSVDGQPASRHALEDIGFGLETSATSASPTRRVTIQAGLGANTFGVQDLVTIDAFIARANATGECTFQLSALVQAT